VLQTETALGSKGTLGVATPGAISPRTGLIKNSNSTALIGHPLDTDLSALLDRPVRVANDANCFALSEAVDGAASAHRVVFGVIAGTGCGGGIAIDKRVWTGPNAIAGEWGHNPLPWPKPEQGEVPGPLCPCGKHGCIEMFLSGTAIAADYVRHGGKPMLKGADVVAAAASDPPATQTMALYYDRFARALASVINLLDPDAIVLGGGASNNDALYDELPKRLPAYAFSDFVDTPILRNKHGDSSGVRGAAWLWPDA
jgi:fructokinase